MTDQRRLPQVTLMATELAGVRRDWNHEAESVFETMYLFLDTETTGVKPTDRIVSICWMLYDGTGNRQSTSYQVIRPDGFTIPAEAAQIHGITTERAHREGADLRSVLTRLTADVESQAPRRLIGHNIAFDRPILLNEFGRLDLEENISHLPTFCTMRSATEICRIPYPNGGRGHKWPTLEELHRHLFGTGVAGAHNAESDVAACAECFFELKRRGVFRD